MNDIQTKIEQCREKIAYLPQSSTTDRPTNNTAIGFGLVAVAYAIQDLADAIRSKDS